MADDIAQWLEELGLGQHAPAFRDNGVELRDVAHLSDDDLTSLGLPLGHRRRLQEAAKNLPAGETAAHRGRPDPQQAEAERRQLTVMFCDLVGSTRLSERLDPEDLREVLRAYQETCAEAVARYDGHLAKYIGDGLLVYFGYPQAHEDDARRAVSAGLGIVEGVSDLNQRLAGTVKVNLEVRVGIHTGLVVAGEMGGGETREADAIVGETPNVASRLEGLAKPNTVAISAATHALIDGLFECHELGARRLKGVSEAVGVYQVLAESGAPSRFEAAAGRGLLPLVGREEEIGLLEKRWKQARDGEGQVVLLSGEAGVGKSRIVRGFRDRIDDQPYSWVLYYGSPYHQNSAFHPVTEQLQRVLRFNPDDGPEEKRGKLEAVLGELGLDPAQTVPPLAALLSLPLAVRNQVSEPSPQELKAKTLDAVIAVFAAMAAQAPVLMVVEDAHWIDPSTVELLSLAVDRLPAARLLVLITFRPEFAPPWAGRANLTQLTLNRLGRQDAAVMVSNVTGGKALPDEVLDQIVAKTDGVPLYVEELTSMVLESGLLTGTDRGYALARPLTELAIPSSLKDSLMARLDRLASVKEVAQLAAVIGRGFGQELLAAASPRGEAEIAAALDKLVEAGVVYRRGSAPAAAYEFKHALVRDAAYESLLKRTRQQHHGRIAEVLVERFAAIAEAEPEVVAHHYTEAGVNKPAAEWWLSAGERAIERAADAEVAAHCGRGLELISLLPEGRQRDDLELRLLLARGPSVASLKGHTSREVRELYSRAHDLTAHGGTANDRFMANWGLWLYRSQSGQHKAGQALVDHLLVAAGDQSDPGLELQAHHCAWTTLFALDDLPGVLAHTEKGMALYDIDRHRGHAFRYGGHDPGVCCHIHAALAQWQLGFPDQAPATVAEAITLSNRLEHPTSQVIAVYYATMLNHYLRLAPQVEASARSMLEIAERHDLPHYLPIGHVLRGWSIAIQDNCADGIAEIEQGLEGLRARGVGVRLSYYLSLLAEAHARAEAPERALDALNEALEAIKQTGERRWQAEINRLMAEQSLALSPGDTANAQRHLERALDVARAQGAKSLELRAATSLARLWAANNKREQAHNLLSTVYDWFTEGFDTADLKDAKVLLDELG
jgi:predicted ATPase/class 3 adenylate cyclase